MVMATVREPEFSHIARIRTALAGCLTRDASPALRFAMIPPLLGTSYGIGVAAYAASDPPHCEPTRAVSLLP